MQDNFEKNVNGGIQEGAKEQALPTPDKEILVMPLLALRGKVLFPKTLLYMTEFLLMLVLPHTLQTKFLQTA